jgi:hypothetical protein
MQNFQIKDNVATLEVTDDDFRVTVTILRKNGGALTREDAEVSLTKAMRSFPQRTRSP